MKARIADNSFWLGVYLVRLLQNTQMLASYIHATTHRLPSERYLKKIVLRTLDSDRYLLIKMKEKEFNDVELLKYLMWDPKHLNSLGNCLEKARYNARNIQELLNEEVWGCFNTLSCRMKNREFKELFIQNKDTFFTGILDNIYSMIGLIHLHQPREEPYYYINSGFYLEQLTFTLNFIQSGIDFFGAEDDLNPCAKAISFWMSILNLTKGKDLFLRRCTGEINTNKLSDFFLFDKTFSGSCSYHLEKLHEMFVGLKLVNRIEELENIVEQMKAFEIKKVNNPYSIEFSSRFTKLYNDIRTMHCHFFEHELGIAP